MSVSEEEFERLPDDELHGLVEAIIAASDDMDPDLESGVLTINFEDDSRFVVNSHRAARQIWMAADRSAWHFDYAADKHQWIATQSGAELWAALSELISKKLGRAIVLSRA